MAEDSTGTKAPRWPYTSFKTLLNWIQRLAESGAVPPRIDRSILPGSEGQKTQVFAALRFFGLVAENGEVSQLLTQLVNQEKQRPQLFRELLAKHYPEATRLAGVHATAKQLEETFEGTTGDTTRKAVAFYLHAAKFAQHPTSKNFKVPTGFSKPRKRTNGNGGGIPDAGAAGGAGGGGAMTANTNSGDAKSRYLDMLLTKASAGDTLDPELLDRIERLIGAPSSETTSK
jgi:hypothetical protein